VETGWVVPTKQVSVCAGSREDQWQVHALPYVLYMVVFVVKLIQANADSAGLLAVFALYISAPSANAELIFDKVHIIQNNLLLKYCTCLPSIVTSNTYIPQAGNAYTEVQDEGKSRVAHFIWENRNAMWEIRCCTDVCLCVQDVCPWSTPDLPGVNENVLVCLWCECLLAY